MIAALRGWLRRHDGFVAQATPVAIALVATLVAAFAVGRVTLLKNANQFVSDVEMSISAAPEPMDSDIVVVAITEDTIANFPYRSPIDRSFLNGLLTKIAGAHPRAIGLDLLFDQPTEADKDARLSHTLRTLPVPLVVAYADYSNLESAEQKSYLDKFVPPDLRGYVNLGESNLNVVRWIYPGAVASDKKYVPGLARALAAKVGVKTQPDLVPMVWHGQPDKDTPAFREIPANAVAVLPAAVLQTMFAGKIVLIGSDLTLVDRHHTPFDTVDPSQTEMAGVTIQAHALSQLLRNRHSPGVGWIVNLLIVFVCAAMGVKLGATDLSVLSRIGAGAGFVVLLTLFGVALYYFGGAQIGLVTPSLAMLLSLWTTDSLTGRDARQQREFIRGAFARYVSPKVVEQLILDPTKMSLEGERREMTFLFSDIAGFTTMAEGLESHEVARLLNDYLEGVTQCVLAHDGMVDKFIGDAVFAIFNAPVDLPEHAQRAVECALAMDRFAYQYHLEQTAKGIPFGITRIGVHTGPAMIGNFGSRSRFNYTAQGDSVNTASRLEALNKHFHTRLAVSGATSRQCHDIAFRPIAEVVLMGKTAPIEVWEPLQPGDTRDDFMARYATAYSGLKDGQAEVRDLLTLLASEAPDDPCVALHLARLAKGDAGVLIAMSEK
jgi:adenylate cyclase